MNWFPWKKKQEAPKVEPRRLEIPAEKVRHIMVLSDTYGALKSGQDKAAHYDLWAAVAEIFPETAEGRWGLDLKDAMRAFVVERIDDSI